jgi:hypothetical protein
MCGAHACISGCSVLQVVPVAILFYIVPFDSRLCGSCGIVVFCSEIVLVVGLVNLCYVLFELTVWFEVSLFVREGKSDLLERVQCFEA